MTPEDLKKGSLRASFRKACLTGLAFAAMMTGTGMAHAQSAGGGYQQGYSQQDAPWHDANYYNDIEIAQRQRDAEKRVVTANATKYEVRVKDNARRNNNAELSRPNTLTIGRKENGKLGLISSYFDTVKANNRVAAADVETAEANLALQIANIDQNFSNRVRQIEGLYRNNYEHQQAQAARNNPNNRR